MDKLTELKKKELIRDCMESANLKISPIHYDIRRMYGFLADQIEMSKTSKRVDVLKAVKASLDYLSDGILNRGE